MPTPSIVRSASRGLETLLDRVLCVCGAVAFSQLPEFMQQYLQRLEGHLDEARLQVDRFKAAAAQAGTTLDQMIAGAGQNPDPAMARLGGVIRASVARVDDLSAADAALRHATMWNRPFAFLGSRRLGNRKGNLDDLPAGIADDRRGIPLRRRGHGLHPVFLSSLHSCPDCAPSPQEEDGPNGCVSGDARLTLKSVDRPGGGGQVHGQRCPTSST